MPSSALGWFWLGTAVGVGLLTLSLTFIEAKWGRIGGRKDMVRQLAEARELIVALREGPDVPRRDYEGMIANRDLWVQRHIEVSDDLSELLDAAELHRSVCDFGQTKHGNPFTEADRALYEMAEAIRTRNGPGGRDEPSGALVVYLPDLSCSRHGTLYVHSREFPVCLKCAEANGTLTDVGRRELAERAKRDA